MSINKKIIIASIGGVLLILLIFAAIMLFTGIRQFGEAESKQKTARATLDSFYRRDPFPSADNVKVVSENIKVLEGWTKDISDFAKRSQVEPDSTRSPSAFVNMLSQVRNELHAKAKKEGVQLDAEFGFGFAPYYEGRPATAEFVPRLIQQLAIIGNICNVLIENKVKEITFIERDLFDGGSTAAAAPAGPRGGVRGGARPPAAGQVVPGLRRASSIPATAVDKDAGELLDGQSAAKMRFVFEFSARESSLINILNRLASSDMFILVTSVDIEVQESEPEKEAVSASPARGRGVGVISMPFGSADEAQEAVETREDTSKPKKVPSRSERVVLGGKLESPAKIRLEFEVYRFR